MDATIRYVVRRFAFALIASVGVITLVFLLFAFTPDPYLAELLYYKTKYTRGNETAAVLQLKQAYITSRGLHRPLWVRYIDWLSDIVTLDWGRSFQTGAPVSAMVAAYTKRTAMYVLPAVVVSAIASAFIGLYSAANRRTLLDRTISLGAYVGIGIPNFWLAAMALIFLRGGEMNAIQVFLNDPRIPLSRYVLPAAVLSTVLLGNQIHYARAEIHEHLNERFVEVLRAKGLSNRRVAWQVLRNAAMPLTSVVFADLLAVLVLHVFVIEKIFSIPGLGRLLFLAVDTRDLPLITGVMMVVVFVGIFGTLLQDVVALLLDPRVRDSNT
ncbi:MAG: ABC transporter permease [Halodesulfurarchaeum sp.]